MRPFLLNVFYYRDRIYISSHNHPRILLSNESSCLVHLVVGDGGLCRTATLFFLNLLQQIAIFLK